VVIVVVVVMVVLLTVIVVAVLLEVVEVTLVVSGERPIIGSIPTSSSTIVLWFERAIITRTPGPLMSTKPDQDFVTDASLFAFRTLPPMRCPCGADAGRPTR
jgi:hypothetical protein